MKLTPKRKEKASLFLFLAGILALAVAASAPGVFAATVMTFPALPLGPEPILVTIPGPTSEATPEATPEPTLAPAPAASTPPAPVPRSILDEPEKCAQARALLDELPGLWQATLAVGDPTYALALRLEAGEALSGQEHLLLSTDTERLDHALEAIMTKIQEIDALIPAGDIQISGESNLDRNVSHLKAGIAAEAPGVFRRRLLNVSMAALLSCDIGPELDACSARKMINAYVRQAGTGRFGEVYDRQDKYAELKASGLPALESYAEHVRARLCL